MTTLIATNPKLTEESEFLANEHGGTEVVQQVKVHEFPQSLVAGEIPAQTQCHSILQGEIQGEMLVYLSARNAAKTASCDWRHHEKAAPSLPDLSSFIAITRHTLSSIYRGVKSLYVTVEHDFGPSH